MIACPTPDKVSYWTRKLARQDTRRKSMGLRAYKCACGSWHLSKQPRRAKEQT